MITREIAEATYPSKPLGEVAAFLDHKRRPVKQSERKVGAFPYYGANGIQGTIDGFIFDEPLILLAEDGGHFDDPDRGIAYEISGKSWVNNHAHVLRPRNGDLDLTYLRRVLENYDVRPFINGSTRSKLTKAQAERIPIPLPPVDEQRRIAAILDKADALRQMRNRALDLLHGLSRSIFLEMFGDPLSNPKRWGAKPLAAYESFLTSGSRGWAKYYSHAGKAFIRIQNLQKGELSTEDIVFVDAPRNAEATRTTVRAGDVLISITADLGRTAVVPNSLDGQAHINQHIALIRVSGIDPTYLSMYLASEEGQRQFNALNRQGVKAGLNFNDIRSLRILEPPVDLQRKYVFARNAAVQMAKRSISVKSCLDTLFSSLQHRAFSGQL